MTVDLSDAGRAVLELLMTGPVAWRSPGAIAQALGRNEPETTDLLCDLDVSGWLSLWETDDGLLVTLSPLGAERLGARLVETGPGETPRWARLGDPDPAPPRPKNVCRSDRAASLDFVADPCPPPDAVAPGLERAEALARAAGAPASGTAPATPRRDDLPRPTLLLGAGLTPWPGPGAAGAADCPACGGRTLGPRMYCLYCDRWGLDALLLDPSRPAAESSRPSRAARPAPDQTSLDRRQADHDRARRKAKRRFRHRAQEQAERRKAQDARAAKGPGPHRNPPGPSSRPTHPLKPPGTGSPAPGAKVGPKTV